jgi:hypothetical protein
MTMIYRLMLSIMLVLLLSCTKDSSDAPPAAGPAPAAPARGMGSTALSIVPEKAYAGSTLGLMASGFELPGGGGEDRVVWKVNGTPVSSADPHALDLGEHLVSRGDTVQAIAYIGGAEIASALMYISNNPPRITGYFFNDPGEASGNFTIDVQTEDPDGDPVTLEYQWTVNGILMGTGRMADLSPSPEDEIEVVVRAYDGEDYSEEIREKFTLLNRPPRFERVKDYFMVGSTYIYNASATDPDMEPVIFSLVNAPAGMNIDPASGQVRWDLPPDFLGTVEYFILAADPKGLKSVMQMKFGVIEE